MLRTSLLLLTATLLRLSAAELIELTLDDGRVVRGTLIEETAEKVVVESHMAGRKGGLTVRQTVTPAQITGRRALPAPVDEYPRMAAAAGQTAADQLGLADWCRENGLGEQAAVHAKRCVELDPGNERGRQMMATLGFQQLDGAWLTEADFIAKTGKVRYRDRFVTPDEAKALQAADAIEASKAKADQAVNDSANGVTRAERRVKELDTQIADNEKRFATATAELATAKAAAAAYDAAKNELKAAEAAAANEQYSKKSVSSGTQQRVNAAQAKVAQTRRGGDASTAATALQRIESKRTSLRAARDKALADLVAATDAQTKAKVAASTAAQAVAPAAPATPAGPPAVPATPAVSSATPAVSPAAPPAPAAAPKP